MIVIDFFVSNEEGEGVQRIGVDTTDSREAIRRALDQLDSGFEVLSLSVMEFEMVPMAKWPAKAGA